MRLFLSGGGDSTQTRDLDLQFFRSLGDYANIAYIPVALRGIRTFPECQSWFEQMASAYGTYTISVLDNLQIPQNPLDNADAIYIGGGNTYSLFREINLSGFREFLLEFAHAGKPIYGGSAGAVILGKDVRIIEHMDRDDFNTKNTAALNLASGYAIYPHYDETADQQILTFVTDTSIPVLAIPEGSGVWVSADLQAISSVWCFDAYGKKAQLAERKDLEC